LNLYTYCENDPIIYSDPTGNYAAYVVQALESPYGQEIIAAAKALGMKVGQYVSLYGPLIENKAIAAVDKGKKAVSSGSKWLKGKLSSSGGQDPNKFKGVSKTQSVLNAGSKADALKAVDKLPSNIKSNVKSFFKGGSNKYTNSTVERMSNGNYLAKMTKPGDVPGSKAIYYKEISPNGTTIKVYKNTFDPAGNLVHTKPK
jgi:hypothetical protein